MEIIMEQIYFAHRGLFDNKTSYPENTMAAFKRAVDKGYGIELDVHLTRDKKLVVIHDHVLTRICGEYLEQHKGMDSWERLQNLKIEELDYEEIKELTIYGSKEKIPAFRDVLKLVNGRVPLIIEIKCEKAPALVTKCVARMLEKYHGEYCIESFHPLVLNWLRKNKPDIIRGQLSTNYYKDKVPGNRIRNFFLTHMALNILTKPDFIAYNHKYAGNISFQVYTKCCRIPAYAWTIRSREELEKAKKNFEKFIFEQFEA
jgi:glycerophosphoryl diester phosphodiesterase